MTHEDDSRMYHAMCRRLWQVVKGDGVNDCADIAATEIERLRTQLATANADLAAMKKERDTARECAFNFMQLEKAAKSDLATANADNARLGRELEEARASARDTDRWRVKAECYGAMVHGVTPALEASGHKEVLGPSGIVSLRALADVVVSDLIKTRKELTAANARIDRLRAVAECLAASQHYSVRGGGADAGRYLADAMRALEVCKHNDDLTTGGVSDALRAQADANTKEGMDR